ncbi:4-hydroxybenzoate polyprenyltransferase [Solimonas aquatica]|uniref:4-hydroxybenzoate octaprenyltransferase n=1 Tax=Solimonas aquatica TaxID=489703 RepID=A0A1H9BPR3_9GAMM|nr:4-hydroxybenzoate octaprenyltransferase [Solimonas aquatica]SEP90970.1 4-hydroxybenzoate polyprenyltransferase [Solimonas aquatica]
MNSPTLSRLADYAQLMRLHRPIGIYLLLWPTLWALWLAADGWPGWHLLLVFVLGTVLMRSAGCAINDFADRDFDPHVARTRERPLAAGRVKPGEALRLFVLVSLIAFGLLSSLHNLQAIWLSLPAVLLAGAYPFAKRHLDIPQAILGLAFSAGIPMAFAAARHDVDWPLATSLIAANLLWVISYDTYYAMTDREDDLKIGVRSSAILFGRHDRLITALTQALSLAILLGVGLATQRGAWFYAGLAVATLCALYEQWLIREREPQACFRAFLHAHYSGLAIWLGLVLDFL